MIIKFRVWSFIIWVVEIIVKRIIFINVISLVIFDGVWLVFLFWSIVVLGLLDEEDGGVEFKLS